MTNYTKRQQKANRRKWVKALRSGKYKRGEGSLHDAADGSYCCLGVACEISGLGKWRETIDGGFPWANTMLAYKVGSLDADNHYLPEKVQNWLGLASEDGQRARGKSLAQLNDDGASFNRIALVIENEPEGLVVK